MGGFTPDGYESRSVDELYDNYMDSIDQEYGDDLEPYQGAFVQALFMAFSISVAEQQEADLEQLYDSLFIQSASGDELTKLARGYGFERRPAIEATGVVEWTRDPADNEFVVPAGTRVTTELPDPVEYQTTIPTTFNASVSNSGSTTYTTSDTGYVTKKSYTVDVTHREYVDVAFSYASTNSSYTAYARAQTDSSVTIIEDSQTSTSATDITATYDTSGIEGDLTIHFQIRVSNSSGGAELQSTSYYAPGEITARSNIEALNGGTQGNVGADRVTRMPSPPVQVTGVTNPYPVGDPSYDLRAGQLQQTLGMDREDDASLRERVLESTSIGGAATVPAVKQAVRALEGAPSLTIYTNRTLTDNANGNGLPKLSTELVIYGRGASDKSIATAIHETASIGDRLVNGINGTAASYTITDTALAQDRVIEWTMPQQSNLVIDIAAVTESGYEGDEAVKNVIAEYIGGTKPDGGVIAGLDVGEDVILDEIERRVNSLRGVIGVSTLTIDADDDGTDDTTTRSDGLTAYEVSTNEVALVDATTDITVTNS